MSEIVKPGPWQLLFVVVDRESGLLSYLTSNGLDKVVTIEPKNEPDKQKWLAKPVEGKEDYYRIVQDIFTPGAEYYGLAQVNGSNKVILSKQPGEWRLEYVPADVSIYKTYKIHPPTHVIGVNHLLGKEPEGNEAVIQTFPVVIPGKPHPAWQFEGGPVALPPDSDSK